MLARLGRNQGRYHGESIAIDDLQAEIHGLALSRGWAGDTLLDEPNRLIRAYRRPAPGSNRNIYISAGVHGDEPSGPLAVLELLREDAWPHANLWLMPCLNPTGFRRNTRENEEGIDLNRDYRRLRTREVTAHVRWFQRQPNFHLTLLLHEDWESNGFYVYELNPEGLPSLAEAMIEAAGEICPVETAELVDQWECRAGIIRPKVEPKNRLDWAEAVYLISNNSFQNYTLETPSDYALPLRVSTHLHVARRAMEAFTRS